MNRYLIVTGDFVTTGGMDRANHALASFLADRGDEVHLAAFRASEDLIARPNVTFHHASKPLNTYLLGSPMLARLGRSVAKEVASRGGRVVTNGGNCDWPDVNWVHYVHAAWPPTTSGGPARRLKAAWSNRRNLKLERERVGRARLAIANSERTRRDMISLLNVHPDRARTIYLGVDAERFRPPTDAERVEARSRMGWGDDRPVVAFVGAMGDRRKGFDTLYAAWKTLSADSSWDARLAVIGAGASLGEWKARAEAEGLSRSIEFLGFRRDVPDVLAACDALASPVRYEAYGLNVQEALCMGLPSFVSSDSGVAERYPESLSGLLLPDPDDAADLAARLKSWRSQTDVMRRAVAPLGESLRARTWAVMAREIAAAIDGDDAPAPIAKSARES